MGVCYLTKNPKQVVVNSKLTTEQTKSDNFPKSKLLLIKTGQLIIFKHKIRYIYYTNSFRQIELSNYMKNNILNIILFNIVYFFFLD